MEKADIKQLCERRFKQLLNDYGLPEPDAVKHEESSVVFIWDEQKVMVRVDLDDFLEREARDAFNQQGIAA